MLLGTWKTESNTYSQDAWLQDGWDSRSAYIWCFTSALAAITTKQLLLETNYEITLCLLAIQILVAQIIFHIFVAEGHGETEYQRVRQARPQQSYFVEKWQGFKECLDALPSAIPLALSSPFLAGTLANFLNQRTMPMFFLFPYVVECLIAQITLRFTNRRMCQRYPTYICLLLICCFSIILFDEYRLDLRGYIFLFVGLALLGLSNFLYTPCYTRAIEHNPIITEKEFWERHAAISFPLSLVCIIIAAFIAEDVPAALRDLWECAGGVLLYFNLAVAGTALALGLNITAYPSRSTTLTGGPLADGEDGWKVLLVTLSSSLLVIFCIPMVELTYYSPFQTLAFSAVIVNALGVEYFGFVVTSMKESWPPKLTASSRFSRFQPYLVAWTLIFAMNLMFLAWSQLTFFLSPTSYTSAIQPVLDLSYIPPRPFDIVVSLYKEDLNELARTLDEIKSLPNIEPSYPEVHIYLKDPDADMTYVQEVTKATTVTRLENSGREGGTFLHHILAQWDNLAAHTLYMQGSLAQGSTPTTAQVIKRIRNYYNPDTGMLPLGFSEMCDCDSCSDRYDWDDDFDLVQRVYSGIHAPASEPAAPHSNKTFTALPKSISYFPSVSSGEGSNLTDRLPHESQPLESDLEDSTCSEALLIYKGQFIASAPRTRGAPHGKAIFTALNDSLLDPGSGAHIPVDAGGQLPTDMYDSLDQPYLGYAVERLWGVLMQCTDKEIAWKCPSMLSGWRTGGGVWDCQCQDEQFVGWR